ncbi:hypothetical protein KBD34_05530 [Patescibacteria group bacterium]|nr:hypothetical protein [Patescibacteria group bacterium]
MSDSTTQSNDVSPIDSNIRTTLDTLALLDPDLVKDSAWQQRLKLVAERASELLRTEPAKYTTPFAAIKIAYLSLATFVLTVDGPEAAERWHDRREGRAILFTRSEGEGNDVVTSACDRTANSGWFAHLPALRPRQIKADNGLRAYGVITQFMWLSRFGTLWVMVPNDAVLETLLSNFFPGVSRSLLDARAVFPTPPEAGGLIVIRDGKFLIDHNP